MASANVDRDSRPDVTDAEIEAGLQRGRARAAGSPIAVAASYDEASDVVVVLLDSGVTLLIPRRLLQGLESATPAQAKRVEVESSGIGLRWPELDLDFLVGELVRGTFGSRRWMTEIARKGGSSRSDAKAAAARANGKKGGRPRRTTTSGDPGA